MNINDAKRKFGIDVVMSESGIRPSKKSHKDLYSVGYKYCTECRDIKKIHKFRIVKRKAQGCCKVCKNARVAKLRKDNGRNDYKGYTASRKEYNKKKYIKNRDTILKRNQDWINNNKSSYKAIQRKASAKRRAAKLNSTPKWADMDKIDIIYRKSEELSNLLGIKIEVDHVIPLQGKNVCGLHIWENMQLLEKTLNIKKNNKFRGE